MVDKLDETDCKILELLQENGRMLFKDLALRARVSVPTVRYRIRKLQEKGIIRKFSVILDSNKIGGVKAVFSIFAKGGEFEEVARKLSELEEVREVSLTSGPLAMFARAEVFDSIELVELARKISKIPGITPLMSIVIDTLKNETVVRIRPGG